MLITTDQNNFIVDWQLNDNQSDVNITSEIVKRMQEQYNGNVSSHSFDKGFSKQSVNQELRKAYPQTNLVIKKKGKCNKTEREIESELEFRTLYNQHNAIESNIHELMSCGMDICPDKGISNYRRYACLSVLTYNMKKVGQLLAKQSKKPPAKTQSKRAAKALLNPPILLENQHNQRGSYVRLALEMIQPERIQFIKRKESKKTNLFLLI